MKQIKVKNLDTGEEMDLVEAEDQLPASVNPLSLHIMRLTSEYVSGDRSHLVRSTSAAADSDTESLMSSVSSYTLGGKKKKNSVRKFWDKNKENQKNLNKPLITYKYKIIIRKKKKKKKKKKNSKWPTQKKLIFQNHQFSKFFRENFSDLSLG